MCNAEVNDWMNAFLSGSKTGNKVYPSVVTEDLGEF